MFPTAFFYAPRAQNEFQNANNFQTTPSMSNFKVVLRAALVNICDVVCVTPPSWTGLPGRREFVAQLDLPCVIIGE